MYEVIWDPTRVRGDSKDQLSFAGVSCQLGLRSVQVRMEVFTSHLPLHSKTTRGCELRQDPKQLHRRSTCFQMAGESGASCHHWIMFLLQMLNELLWPYQSPCIAWPAYWQASVAPLNATMCPDEPYRGSWMPNTDFGFRLVSSISLFWNLPQWRSFQWTPPAD